MTREILFRGKDVKNCKWRYGCIFHDKSLTDRVFILDEYVHDDNDIHDTKRDFCLLGYEVDPNTVGQATGLKDKHGKMVFEQDIIKTDFCEAVGEVFWDEAPCSFAVSWNDDKITYPARNFDVNDLEVIGNIHDNPELMEAS